jgi:sugar phosphate isomerase/epimerase
MKIRVVSRNISFLIAGICFMLFSISGSLEYYQPDYAVCAKISDYPKLRDAGYKYVESNVAYLMPNKSDEEFQVHLDEIRSLNAKIISCTGFIPGNLPVVGSEANHDGAFVWADSALRRAGLVGISYIVFGSGKARNIPDGFNRKEAFEQFVSFCKQIAPLAKKYNVTVVIEPLNSAETNFINSLSDGAAVVEAVDHPNVRLLCDIYHMAKENESAGNIIKYGRYIRHCHIAEKEGRTSPGIEGDDFTPYFRALKQIDYKGCVSIECRWDNFDNEYIPALKYMREQFKSLQ